MHSSIHSVRSVYSELKQPMLGTLSIDSEEGGGAIFHSRGRIAPRKMEFYEELLDIYGPSFLTRYNNQSSVLMCSVTCNDLTDVRPKKDLIMLLHDTRVYYFKVSDQKMKLVQRNVFGIPSKLICARKQFGII